MAFSNFRSLGLLACGAFAPAVQETGSTPAASERTNVIVVTTDDLDAKFDLDARRPDNGQSAFPNLLALRERGVLFTESFVSLPLCSPSRASMLTGRYAHNHGVRGNPRDDSGVRALAGQPTLAVALSSAGFRTGLIGKYVNGYSAEVARASEGRAPPGWEHWFATLDPTAYFDWNAVSGGGIVEYSSAREDYAVDVLAREAEAFLERARDDRRPFFLMLNFFAPHDGKPGLGLAPVPAPRHEGLFRDWTPDFGPAFDEEAFDDKLEVIGEAPRLSAAAQLEIVRRARARRETMMSVDDALGRIVARLRELGLEDRTAIVFTSDNGLQQGEHRLPGGKGWPYEESLRVPLIAAGPGLPHGARCERMVLNLDLAPTVLAWCGVRANGALERAFDGRSWLGVASGADEEWRLDFLVEGPRERGYVGVRSESSVYVEHDRDRDGQLEACELYFVASDPHQLSNRAKEPESAAALAKARARLAELRACAGADCR